MPLSFFGRKTGMPRSKSYVRHTVPAGPHHGWGCPCSTCREAYATGGKLHFVMRAGPGQRSICACAGCTAYNARLEGP